MFNKLKQIKDLRSQAKTLQNTLAQEKVTVEKHGITLTLNGNMEIVDLKITDKSSSGLENDIKDCLNDAIKQAQKVMAKKMQEMGGLGDLGNLLKN